MHNIILLGNMVSFVGAVLMIAIGLIKTKENILKAQCVQFAVMGTSNLILGGVSGALANAVGVARNLVCLKRDYTLGLKLFFVALQAGMTLYVNKMGLIGLLPVLSTVLYTVFLDLKNEVVLKSVLILCQLCWVIYDLVLMNYVAFACDLFTIVTTIIGIMMILRDRHSSTT